MKHVNYQERKLAYQITGKGYPVVLLHGFSGDSRIWHDFQQDLLEEGFQVLLIDLPGFGQSATGAEASIAYYAQACACVIEAVGYDKFVLVGHSMGGYTALTLAASMPNKVKGLGLFHSHPYADTDEKKADRQKQIAFVQRMGHQLYIKQLVPKLFPPSYVQSRPFELDKLIHRAARFPQQGIIDGLQAMAERPDNSAWLKECPCPVLFIVGAEDAAIPAAYSEKQLALPPISSIHILEGVGHMGMIEQKRKCQLIVRRFVNFCLAQ